MDSNSNDIIMKDNAGLMNVQQNSEHSQVVLRDKSSRGNREQRDLSVIDEERLSRLEFEENERVRYRCTESEENEFFEFNIQKLEVSNDTVLIVTDFAEEADMEDQRLLWESQIKTLMRQIGA